jgi:hypothetical protein
MSSRLCAGIVVTILAATVLAGCSTATKTSSSSSLPASTTTSSKPSSTTIASTTSTSSAPSTTTTLGTAQIPAVQATIYPTGVVLTTSGHVAGLAQRVTNPHLASPTSFVLTLSGVDLTSGAGTAATTTVTSPTGGVASVAITAQSNGVLVTVALRTPATNYTVAAGAGTDVQVTFS